MRVTSIAEAEILPSLCWTHTRQISDPEKIHLRNLYSDYWQAETGEGNNEEKILTAGHGFGIAL